MRRTLIRTKKAKAFILDRSCMLAGLSMSNVRKVGRKQNAISVMRSGSEKVSPPVREDVLLIPDATAVCKCCWCVRSGQLA
ncbi:hypothetical protein Y1Q_0011254 [Alligator mississippiensis]|uniref:Uncharacterized protein n=1 Tax=Alligator mississippiensis TaxID=8496 RepID=A0A151N814_ALLMI|nr:hypothetical protein Y1Q_0011254 [Alligator mississippiensis]